MKLAAEKEDVAKEVDDEIGRFNTFFQGLKNDGLTRFEIAILKSFITWKLKYEKDSTPGPQPHP